MYANARRASLGLVWCVALAKTVMDAKVCIFMGFFWEASGETFFVLIVF